ncbi:MAG: type III-A CRISPR-associated RAMP protein Csm4 [Anaerolineae bacterium]|nr:type III-A CRISPR-associated RAMP protein Csm4 [Anaerolineae bacterium]
MMMNLTTYKFQPRSGVGFHFGEQGLELEESQVTFPSDSLFAAMVATVAEQEGKDAADAFARPFAEKSPTFRLTSVFPIAGDLPLLPLPRLSVHTKATDEAEREKLLPRKFNKKVRFISPDICQKLCAAADMDAYLTEEKGRFLQGGAIWLTAAEQARLPKEWRAISAAELTQKQVWQQHNVPRVTVDRVHNNSTPFLIGRVVFSQGCGLWVGVQGADTAVTGRVELLLHHLGDRGIGGERSSGYGGYQLIKLDFTWPQWEAGNGYYLLLSRYLPVMEEIKPALQAPDKHLISYQLVTVGGWLATPYQPHLRRKQISLLAEGSIVGAQVSGRMEDVRPEWVGFPHAVWRNGFALTIPVTAKERESA